MVSINEFKGWLNSLELAAYEFLCGIRGVNSVDELGDLICDAYMGKLDLRLGSSVYRDSFEFIDYVRGLNGLVFKYMVSLPNQVFTLRIYDNEVDHPLELGFKVNGVMWNMDFKFYNKPDRYSGNYSRTGVLTDCKVSWVDRGLGMFSISMGDDDNIHIGNLDLDMVTVVKFRYKGGCYINSWLYNEFRNIRHIKSDWDKYFSRLQYLNTGTIERVNNDDELPF